MTWPCFPSLEICKKVGPWSDVRIEGILKNSRAILRQDGDRSYVLVQGTRDR
jgi:hypothetical protein